jgi:hypothetical protein
MVTLLISSVGNSTSKILRKIEHLRDNNEPPA